MGLLAAVTAVLVVAGFAVAAPSYNDQSPYGYECGSALSPVLQTAGDVGPCNDTLLASRAAAASLAGLAAIGAIVGIRHSRSVGRTHNRRRDQCLVVASAAVFLLAWIALAWLTQLLATYPSD